MNCCDANGTCTQGRDCPARHKPAAELQRLQGETRVMRGLLRQCANAQDVARESVDDALMIVASYGPWGADLNDAHRRQIVLADEVHRLRHLYEMAVHGRAEMRAALRQERAALAEQPAGPDAEPAIPPGYKLVPVEPSAFGVLFAVEQAIQNGDCPWQIEQAFHEYEAERKNGIGEQT